MALSDPRSIFGIHSFSPYSRSTGMPYGIMKVLKSSSVSFQGALVALNGGSAKYPWAVEEGKINSQLNLKVSEYPDFLFQLFGGASPTENGADATGAISSLTNVYGTSLMNATTGIASVAIISGSETDLKFGKYVIKVITATTVQIYCMSDVDFGSGTAKILATDALALASSNYTVTASTATNITGWGFKFTGGSGTIGMTAGDTATFELKPINTANMVLTLGQVADTFPEFGAVCYAKKKGSGEIFEMDLPRIKGEGHPIGLDEDKFSEADVKCMVMYDSTLNYVARIRTVKRSTPT